MEQPDQHPTSLLTVPEQPDTRRAGVDAASTTGTTRGLAPTTTPGREIYLDTARRLVTRWVHIVQPIGSSEQSFAASANHTSRHAEDPALLYCRQAATLGIAILCELDPGVPGEPGLRELVRSSLVRWQLSLRGDGVPLKWRSRSHPLRGAILACVVQSLSESTGFKNESLFGDVGRHSDWLLRRPPSTPWIEAATVCAVADAAVLLREKTLLAKARKRLSALLALQHDEGWFPECGGPDIGSLSLTVDALARVGAQNHWTEVDAPLIKATRFLAHFVHPDGSAGGCYGTRGTGFVTPYGVELLAAADAHAAGLAHTCRRLCHGLRALHLTALSDPLAAAWGSSLLLAAATAPRELPRSPTRPCDSTGHARFHDAGIAIYSTKAYYAVVNQRRGGAVRVTFRSGAQTLDDRSVTVVSSGQKCKHAFDHVCSRSTVTGLSVTCATTFDRASSTGAARPRRLRRSVERIMPRLSAKPLVRRCRARKPKRTRPRMRQADTFRRKITFGDDWIEISDEVRARRRFDAVIYQSPVTGGGFSVPIGAAPQHLPAPIVGPGGNQSRLTRLYVDGELVDVNFGRVSFRCKESGTYLRRVRRARQRRGRLTHPARAAR
ncbi:MAG: hypothetical protein PVI86_00680 [Phycisphaerae bacterium]|jgi:hypothetical protein